MSNSINSWTRQVILLYSPHQKLDFMRKFGYLESGSSTSEALYHEDAVIAAIKNVQKYGALNESGILDNATLEVPFSTWNLIAEMRFVDI